MRLSKPEDRMYKEEENLVSLSRLMTIINIYSLS